MIVRCTIAAAIAFGIFPATVPAIAAESLPTAQVSVKDLDLRSPEGTQMLAQRISGAARAVCLPEDFRDLAVYAEQRKCYATAIGNAQTQVASLRRQLGGEQQVALNIAR